MRANFQIVPAANSIAVTWSGGFILEIAIAEEAALQQHPHYDPSFSRVYDIRGLGQLPELSFQQLTNIGWVSGRTVLLAGERRREVQALVHFLPVFADFPEVLKNLRPAD